MVRAGGLVLPIVLLVAGCGSTPVAGSPARLPPSHPAATTPAETVTEDAFWQLVEDARGRADGDPDAMAEILGDRFAGAADDTLRSFQRQLVAASTRLYTWRHAAAADMACGSLGDDGFTDWRSWVVALGRSTFERIAADPDNLADVEDLTAGCAGAGEWFGAAVSGIYFDRHGYEDDTFPLLEPGGSPPAGTPAAGYPRHGTDPLRATLPRLARRT